MGYWQNMTRMANLFARVSASPDASLAFRDFVRLIEAFGFVLDRTRGSHHIYKRSGTPERLSLQPQGGQAKPYQVRQFLAIVESHGLTLDGTD